MAYVQLAAIRNRSRGRPKFEISEDQLDNMLYAVRMHALHN